MIREACANDEVRAVLVTGGTGVTSRDSTYEAIEALLDKRLPGFGELFRMLSYQEIGAAAMMSRAQLGVHAAPHRRLDARLAERVPARAREARHSRAFPPDPRGQPLVGCPPGPPPSRQRILLRGGF